MDMPRNCDIAEFWFTNQTDKQSFVDCLDEPSCFACGFGFSGRFDAVGNKSWRTGWNKARLERCHLKPKQFGGCNSLHNLVLLCRKCHDKAPDCDDPAAMLRWVEEKKNWFAAWCDDLDVAFRELGVSQSDLKSKESDIMSDRSWMSRLGRHFGIGIKPATIAGAIAVHFSLLKKS